MSFIKRNITKKIYDLIFLEKIELEYFFEYYPVSKHTSKATYRYLWYFLARRSFWVCFILLFDDNCYLVMNVPFHIAIIKALRKTLTIHFYMALNVTYNNSHLVQLLPLTYILTFSWNISTIIIYNVHIWNSTRYETLDGRYETDFGVLGV